jgi:pyruvate formate-lyase activating enzyme-like uncharacterized protein
MGPSKQLRDKVLNIVSKNKDIDFHDIITHMKKEVGIRGDSLIKLVDEILKWWEESGKILRMVDRRTQTGMYRMNENAKIAKDIVSETLDELGIEIPMELHENRQLERFVNTFYKIHPKIKLNGVSKDELEKLADKAMKQGDGGSKSLLLLRTFLKKSGATGMIGEETKEQR